MSTPELALELIITHHKRRRARLPYSASVYLINTALPSPRDLIDSGRCEEAESEGEAARNALRELQERRERLAGAHDALLMRALLDPVGAITKRRTVG